MGSTNSALRTKFHVCNSQPKQSSSSQVVDVGNTEPAEPLRGGFRLRFVDKQFFEDVKTKGEDMKRSAGPRDKAFIEDLRSGHFIEPELSAAMIEEHIQKVVKAKECFYNQLPGDLTEAAERQSFKSNEDQRIRPQHNEWPWKSAERTELSSTNSEEISDSQVGIFPEESEVQQWLTESTTSENVFQTSSDAAENRPDPIFP